MLMNRTFLLACATVLTLGISAASSTPAHARSCSDADSDRQEAACYIRSAIYTAAAHAQERQAARPQQQSQQAAAARVTKPNAASSPASCGLTKEYVNGTVKFRDTCTGEWAERDNIEPKKAGGF